ncbi:secreted protein [Seiridium cupressi]
MKARACLLALVSIPTLVSADCYGSGDKWSSEIQLARDGVDYWCDNTVTNGGGLSGYFNEGQMKTRCQELSDSRHAVLTSQWTGKGGLTLKDEDCKGALKQEIDGCERGGQRTTADWYYSADVNAGGCPNQG